METKTQQRVLTETDRYLDFGRRKGWSFFVLGHGPLPFAQTWVGDWLVVPSHIDSSPIPVRAMQRIQAIYAAGLRPKGFVLVHEAPKLLPANTRSSSAEVSITPQPNHARQGLKKLGLGLAALISGVVALSGFLIMAVAILAIAVMILLPALAIAGALVIDPILVAVTEDDTWIEIDRWDVEA